MASFEGTPKTANVTHSGCAKIGANGSDSTKVASDVGLRCGNPAEEAALRGGESVLYLGSGGGLDVFLAADLVGATGRIIGLGVSKEMVNFSRQNAEAKGVKPPHVAFTQASFAEELPIESCSVDCVLSNCVINLLQEDAKALTLREAYRVLRPGGRVHFSDIAAIRDIPADLKNDSSIYINCVSSEEYESLLRKAGFVDISFSPILKYQETMTLPSFDANQFIAKRISARKPEDTQEEISPTILKRWWDAYPSVHSSPEAMMKEEVASLVRDPSKRMEDFVVVDVRRNDHAGGHVKGSVQCPAQSFYDDAPGYFEKFKNTEKVIFYCQSSNGRGPRCAGWYQDYLDSVGCTSSKAYVLAGGIKGWMAKYKEQNDLMDYD